MDRRELLKAAAGSALACLLPTPTPRGPLWHRWYAIRVEDNVAFYGIFRVGVFGTAPGTTDAEVRKWIHELHPLPKKHWRRHIYVAVDGGFGLGYPAREGTTYYSVVEEVLVGCPCHICRAAGHKDLISRNSPFPFEK